VNSVNFGYKCQMRPYLIFVLLVLIFSILFCIVGERAKAYQIRFGPEIFAKSNSVTDVKFLSLSKEFDLKKNVFWKMEIGYWSDNRSDGSNAAILNPGIGLVLNPFSDFDIRVTAGLAYQTATDRYLGSNLNFTQEVFCGFRDGHARVGFTFNHVSCGCSKPNIGRNFLTLTVGYGF